jgi:hypothetical protein
LSSDRVDKILAGINEAIGSEEEGAVCWFCDERPGLPSTCDECRRYLLNPGAHPDPRSPQKRVPVVVAPELEHMEPDEFDFPVDLNILGGFECVQNMVAALSAKLAFVSDRLMTERKRWMNRD